MKEENEESPPVNHLIILGFGLNGRNLAGAASSAGIPYVVVEMNPETVRREQAIGRPIFYGDATLPAVLEHAGIATARVVVVAISDPAATRRIVELARKMNRTNTIIARTRFTTEIHALSELGADEVIPEEFETSVEIFTRVLSHYCVPRDEIERFIAEVRTEHYKMLRSLSPGAALPSDVRLHIPDVEILTIRVGDESPLAGKSLAELELRQKYGVTLLAIRRGAQTLSSPAGDVDLRTDDLLIVLGEPKNLAAITQRLK